MTASNRTIFQLTREAHKENITEPKTGGKTISTREGQNCPQTLTQQSKDRVQLRTETGTILQASSPSPHYLSSAAIPQWQIQLARLVTVWVIMTGKGRTIGTVTWYILPSSSRSTIKAATSWISTTLEQRSKKRESRMTC